MGLASPNPQVGCVLVRDGWVLGEGAHRYADRDHAEIVALKAAAAAGHDSRGSTAYVTLEPCSHHGRTPPCADALIAAGVARVEVATADPNPQVAGAGLRKLRAAGIPAEITADPALTRRAQRMNDAFACSITLGRPLLTLKSALSAEGLLAPPPAARTAGEPFWLTGLPARAEVQRMRHAADAVLTGIGTVLADNPLLTDRSGLPRRRRLVRAVLDSALRLSPESALVRSVVAEPEPDLWVFCAPDAPAERHAALVEAGVRIIPVEREGAGGGLSLHAVLGAMHAGQCTGVLLEAGTALNTAALAAGLVDRVTLFLSERPVGSEGLPFASAAFAPMELAARLEDSTRTAFGPDTCLSGRLHDPWAAIAGVR